MLTRELAIADYEGGQIKPDRLTRGQHAQYRQLAESMLAVYRDGTGQMRHQLHTGIHRLFEEEQDCPARRIDAFCKLLDEKATYDQDKRGRAAKLRRTVFRLAAKHHPLVESPDQLFESAEADVKQSIAMQLGKSWPQIERELFADVIQFHRPSKFEGYESASHLLSRYNVAQTQAVLYDAVSMTVWARDDFKMILRYAKLARLMHTIERSRDGTYQMTLDGPASILKQTRRYGVALARFLPALLSCSGWRMKANIQHRRSQWQNLFLLSPEDGLTSHVQPADLFDSGIEATFAEKWGPDPREGWRLIREGEILHHNQHVFVPDFLFQHDSGKRILMEIIGFWTPEYLEAKQKTLTVFKDEKILLVIAESLGGPKQFSGTGAHAIMTYKTAIKVNEVLQRLKESIA